MSDKRTGKKKKQQTNPKSDETASPLEKSIVIAPKPVNTRQKK